MSNKVSFFQNDDVVPKAFFQGYKNLNLNIFYTIVYIFYLNKMPPKVLAPGPDEDDNHYHNAHFFPEQSEKVQSEKVQSEKVQTNEEHDTPKQNKKKELRKTN